ncbi:hypothetical protein A2U01_0060802 [Trifolium medium]|uniref:Uncharacterized protein n=1 Tax=Trifolium medium TaxID=97028 RepID=A0A392RUV5_9FABA|nr:hypothetical protein [Trifolium medium]
MDLLRFGGLDGSSCRRSVVQPLAVQCPAAPAVVQEQPLALFLNAPHSS